MKGWIQTGEYCKKKYVVTAAVNGVAAWVTLYVVLYLYDVIGWSVPYLPITTGTVICLFLLGYAIGYLHERIPRCTSPRIESVVRYTGMVLVFSLPLTWILLTPQGLYEVLFWLDVTAAITAVPAIITVLLMYRLER